MPSHIQQANAQSQSGSSGFHMPYKYGYGDMKGIEGNLIPHDPDVKQKLRAKQGAWATAIDKDADVDVQAHRRSNAQGQAQIVQSDYNWLYVKAENEAEQEREHESGGSYQVEYGSPGTSPGEAPGPASGGP